MGTQKEDCRRAQRLRQRSLRLAQACGWRSSTSLRQRSLRLAQACGWRSSASRGLRNPRPAGAGPRASGRSWYLGVELALELDAKVLQRLLLLGRGEDKQHLVVGLASEVETR